MTEALAIDEDVLAETVVAALQRMAFVLADPVAADPTLPECVEIGFVREAGSGGGRVELRADEAFALELAADMLGLDRAAVDLDALGRPALLELANVLAGEVVRLLGGRTEPFRLGLPRSVTEPVPQPDCAAAQDRLVRAGLRSETGGRLTVAVRLDDA